MSQKEWNESKIRICFLKQILTADAFKTLKFSFDYEERVTGNGRIRTHLVCFPVVGLMGPVTKVPAGSIKCDGESIIVDMCNYKFLEELDEDIADPMVDIGEYLDWVQELRLWEGFKIVAVDVGEYNVMYCVDENDTFEDQRIMKYTKMEDFYRRPKSTEIEKPNSFYYDS